MGATRDQGLLAETFDFITNKSRDQDAGYYFAGLALNHTARRPLTKFFYDQYDAVRSIDQYRVARSLTLY